MPRRYEETHPWITFQLDLTELDHMTWLLLGEAISKCDHIAGVPLQPEVAALLNMVYLTKGIHATTQIEGNTLSEEQVAAASTRSWSFLLPRSTSGRRSTTSSRRTTP